MADSRDGGSVFEALGKAFDAQMKKGRAIELLEGEIARLEMRVEDLLAVNNRYLQRARDAETKSGAPEVL